MSEAFENEIQDLLSAGRKIEAVKRYREETGAGLAEAKSAVESIDAGDAPARSGDVGIPELADQIVELLEQGQKIEAIKLYRERSNASLKEAKDVVEEIARKAGIESQTGGGCLGLALAMVASAVVGVTAYFA